MSNRRTRVIAFICAIIVLGGFVVFRSQNSSDGAFEKAQQLMKQLRSSALDAGLSTDQITLLKKQKEDSELRITTLASLVEADNDRARKILRNLSISPTRQQEIVNEFAMASPRSYFNAQYATVLGTTLSPNTELKNVLTSINIGVNDKNIREAYVKDYNELAQNYCTTDDPSVDMTKKGTVKFPLSSRADAVDTCESNVLVQYQCNSQKFADTVRTTCPNGCSNGVCQSAPVVVFSGFSLSLPATATVNTPVDLSITAVKTDNSTDTSYNKSAIILIDGDPQAALPLTAQTLSNGVLSLPGSITFKSVGTKTVIVKDVVSGIQSTKTVTVSAASTTTPPAITCVDSDGGLNYSVKGTTTLSTGTVGLDVCTNATTLQESSCNSNTSLDGTVSTTYTCPNGCSDGACLAAPTTSPACTGTLPAHAITVMGAGNTSRAWTYDSSPTGPYQNCSFKCQSGYLYSNGACTQAQITQPTCPVVLNPVCTNGTLTSNGVDANGCPKPKTCSTPTIPSTPTCPQLSPPPADFCKDGQIIDGGTNANGCQLAPTCGPKLISGSVTIDGVKDCWFGDTTKQLTLGTLLGYQATTNSGIKYIDEILLYGATIPTNTSTLSNILSYEETSWTAADGSTPTNATQLTNFFIFRANSEGTRTWNIPASTRFYGCFARGDRPNTW